MLPRWILPEYIDDVLPNEAKRVEYLRRRLLDLFATQGFELVGPPTIEYLESLLTGSGKDLDLQTFKTIDRLSGRTLGFRADITPQISRIDSHLIGSDNVVRLCYCDKVLRTSPTEVDSPREVIQLGAELFGFDRIEGDIEICRLMLKSLQVSGVANPILDIGNVAILRALLRKINCSDEEKVELANLVQRKSQSELSDLLKNVSKSDRDMVLSLTELFGDRSVLSEARKLLARAPEAISGVERLEAIYDVISDLGCAISFDLAEPHGYDYHSGVVFTAYAQGQNTPLGHGGRYDDIGSAFDRARPATGFTLNLRKLAQLTPSVEMVGNKKCVYAPSNFDDKELQRIVEDLRSKGVVVIADLIGDGTIKEERSFTDELILVDGEWSLKPVIKST